MKTENLAIAFIDIAGFTKRTESQSREENERMLKRFDAVVRPAVRNFSGKVIKTIGDAYLLTFRSSTEALHCSMAIHDGLAEANASVGVAERFDVRAAVNAGDVRIEGNDVFGDAVNIASRIESKTPAGEIYFSEAVYLAMTRSEVPSAEVGVKKLKGVSDRIRLYRIPRASEVGGYRIAVAGNTVSPRDGETHPLAPTDLPYGGLALARVRERGPVHAEAQQKVAALVERAGPLVKSVGGALSRAWGSFLTLFRASQRFRVVTVGIAVAVIVAIVVALAWPKPKPKPLTPWEKLKNRIGIE